MADPGDDDALVIRPSVRARLPVVVYPLVMLTLTVVAALTGIISPAVLGVACAFYALALAISVAAIVQASRADWDVRLDHAGLTVRGHQTVPWSDLAELRISGLQPGRLRWLSLGQKVAAFIPK